MHVIHQHHHLQRAVLAAMAAAVLAIVLTLALAGGLTDLSSFSTPGPTAHAAVHPSLISSPTSNRSTRSLFTSPFLPRVRLPWPAAAR